MAEVLYHYNIVMAADPADALRVIDTYQQNGYETISLFKANYKGQEEILHVAVRRPMTEQEAQDQRMKWAIDKERREKRSRSK